MPAEMGRAAHRRPREARRQRLTDQQKQQNECQDERRQLRCGRLEDEVRAGVDGVAVGVMGDLADVREDMPIQRMVRMIVRAQDTVVMGGIDRVQMIVKREARQQHKGRQQQSDDCPPVTRHAVQR